MRKAVLIVAAGSGSRMGGDLPKQYLPIHGKPVLVHTLERFLLFDPQPAAAAKINLSIAIFKAGFCFGGGAKGAGRHVGKINFIVGSRQWTVGSIIDYFAGFVYRLRFRSS